MGIHYDYKSKRGERAMLKEAKRKARLAQKRAKRMMSSSKLPDELYISEGEYECRYSNLYQTNSVATDANTLPANELYLVIVKEDSCNHSLGWKG